MIAITVAGSNVPALVDDIHADLARYRWRLDRFGYAFRYGDKRIMLHHAVMGSAPSPGLIRDHINRDKMDNRSGNLRWLTYAESNANRGPAKKNATGFRGVCFHPERGKFLATIQRGGKAIVRQWFDDPSAANSFLTAQRIALMPASYEAG